MRPTTPAYAAAITLYLAVAGAAQVLWIDAAGTLLTPGAALLCAVPGLLAGGLALTGRADSPHYRVRLLVAGAAAPPLLLLWSQTQATALPPVVVALHALLVLACHAAALSLSMLQLGIRWTQPLAWLIDLLHEATAAHHQPVDPATKAFAGAAAAAPATARRSQSRRGQFSWVTSLVFR